MKKAKIHYQALVKAQLFLSGCVCLLEVIFTSRQATQKDLFKTFSKLEMHPHITRAL